MSSLEQKATAEGWISRSVTFFPFFQYLHTPNKPLCKQNSKGKPTITNPIFHSNYVIASIQHDVWRTVIRTLVNDYVRIHFACDEIFVWTYTSSRVRTVLICESVKFHYLFYASTHFVLLLTDRWLSVGNKRKKTTFWTMFDILKVW